MLASPSVIARAMDAWRVRLWLTKGPRCPCGCSERIPWSVAGKAGATAFEQRRHIPTPRRPYAFDLHHKWKREEARHIPATLEGFKAYLKERRNVVHQFRSVLYRHCWGKDESWMCALLSYGHATQPWRTSKHRRYDAIQNLFALVAKNWFVAADIVLSWTTATPLLVEEDMMYLVKSPYRTGYEHMDKPLTNLQRNWLLQHPALTEVSRKARNHKHWMQILLWTVYVRSEMRFWKNARVPLPVPCKENVPAFQARITRGEYRLRPGTPFYKDLLGWVSFLAKESPATLRTLLPKMGKNSQWLSDVIETLAPTGRIGLLNNCLRVFGRTAPMLLQKEKIWQWINDPVFANPRITKNLIFSSTFVLRWATQNNQKKGLVSKLFKGEAIVRTIGQNAVWLSNKLPEDSLLSFGKKQRSYKTVAEALRATPRYQSLRRIATLRATVYLTLFFRNHVRLAKAKAATRGDCPICWAPKILQALHGDKRHGMCLPCKRELERKNMLDRCPMCRVSLRAPTVPNYWTLNVINQLEQVIEDDDWN
jgi:hypothetical protein